MLGNIAQRLSRLWARVANLNELPGNPFYSPELEGFSGIGHSVEDCLYKAKWGMLEHIEELRTRGLPVPPQNATPRVTIEDTPRLQPLS